MIQSNYQLKESTKCQSCTRNHLNRYMSWMLGQLLRLPRLPRLPRLLRLLRLALFSRNNDMRNVGISLSVLHPVPCLVWTSDRRNFLYIIP